MCDNNTNEALYEYISERLQELRDNKNMTAQSLSLNSGLNRSYVNKIENLQKKPSLDGLYHVCYTLGINVADFFIKDLSNQKLVELLEAIEGFDNNKLQQLIEYSNKLK